MTVSKVVVVVAAMAAGAAVVDFVVVVVVVVVVVEILRLHVLEVHPKPGPFHRVIWAMKPRQCIRVQFSAVRPISE